MKLRWILSTALIASASHAFAAAPKHKDLDPAYVQAIQKYQEGLSALRHTESKRLDTPARPFSEVEPAGYFFISSDFDFDSAEAKHTMIQNLPAGVTAVVFTEPGSNKQRIIDRYKDVITPDRLKVVELDNASSGFWARDGLPVATWSQKGGEIAMVDARYYHGFEPDAELAGWFHAPLIQNKYYFEGGNFMVNDLGDCISVDNDLSQKMPTDIFTDDYGCKNVIRLPFEKGIGHADESVRFIRSKTVVTDSDSYAKILRAKGFEAVMLPRPDNEYETYVNALLVDDTIFVPVFEEKNDEEALNVYRGFGLKVVPIVTSSLSNDGLGSLHCITMTYPKVPFQQLLQHLGAKEI